MLLGYAFDATAPDTWTCRTWRPAVGRCGAVVPLPGDGEPPARCWRGHWQPWHGTMTRPGAPAVGRLLSVPEQRP